MVELFKSFSGSPLSKDLKCIGNFELKLKVYFRDYHEMPISGKGVRLESTILSLTFNTTKKGE